MGFEITSRKFKTFINILRAVMEEASMMPQ
jgi:hypothetical protein